MITHPNISLKLVLYPSPIITNIANPIINRSCKDYPNALMCLYCFHFYNLYERISKIAVMLHTLIIPIQYAGQFIDRRRLRAIIAFLAYKKVNLGFYLTIKNGHSNTTTNKVIMLRKELIILMLEEDVSKDANCVNVNKDIGRQLKYTNRLR